MIELEHVTKEYKHGNFGLKDVSLQIYPGEFVFVVGKSGSGKTTLIQLLLKEIDATKGKIVVNSYNYDQMRKKDIPYMRRKIGVVFQNFRLLKDRNIYENVAFAQRVIEAPRKQIKPRVKEVLELVGLDHRMKAYPRELSGGEQQRVAIARALVNHPDLLLADEPTGNLDPVNAAEIMHLLYKVQKRGTTVVVVTHNKDIVNRMNQRVIVLNEGKIQEDMEGGTYHV